MAGGVPREERRLVTALFADIVGSTQLGERLDPEDLKFVIQDALSRGIVAVEAYGGTIKDLAGDGFLALFGAPTAHEDDPERAVRAGLQMVEDVAAFGLEAAVAWGIEPLQLRVGINTGTTVVGAIGAGSKVEYGATGDVLNTAARLQTHANPGTVLVGIDTQRSIRQMFTWSDPDELDLKGKEEPVIAFEVTGLTAAPPRAHGLGGVQTRFVGREHELRTGEELIQGVLSGTGGILFVTGEPGIGKTRLIWELEGLLRTGRAARGRSTWLEGRCLSYGESMPYSPFRDLLRSWLGVLSDEPELRVRVILHRSLGGLFGDRADELYPYLATLLGLTLEPEAAARIGELSPEALQFRTFDVVRTLLARLAEDGPLVVALEDVHWADPTSLQLLERLFGDTESSALLLLVTMRPERDHTAWRVKEQTTRSLPHRTRELALEALSGDAGRDLLRSLVGEETLPAEMQRRILEPAEGNPFFIEELVRSLIDFGALIQQAEVMRFDHAVDVEIPPTIEKTILARIDRLGPGARHALMAASVLGRQFGLPLLEGVMAAKDSGDGVAPALSELQRLDLVREGRRWPEPEYRFKHALIQDTAYRTLVGEERRGLHRRAAEWLESKRSVDDHEVAGLLAHHWLGAEDEDKAVAYLTKAGDRARQDYALDEAIAAYRELLPLLEKRGEEQEIALGLFKLALALHMSLRFGEANETYQRAFGFWTPPETTQAQATLRISSSFLPNDPDPRSAIAWPNIQLCMQLFDRLVEAWPERTIVPSLAERWEISGDGLRYVFHLREGTRWSDGTPLTAGDVEFGIKRVLNPDAPGSSVAIYFVLEHGQDHYLRRSTDPDLIGVKALDDLTVEFRLVAPAPYFMSVMNRPDGGPQPRHSIEAAGDSWTEVDRQVVSGPFRRTLHDENQLVLERRDDYKGARPGNVRRVEITSSNVADALDLYGEDLIDVITVRYTPRFSDLVPDTAAEANLGQASWSLYMAFDHAHPVTANLHLRQALAHSIDREALSEALPDNVVVATGGIVPPALQGHTPDIALRFDVDLARSHLERSGLDGTELVLGGLEAWVESFLRPVADMWTAALGLSVEVRAWTLEQAYSVSTLKDLAPIYATGWLPGYPDPEYYLRLLFHSDSRTNEGGFSSPEFDDLIEQARQERSDRERLRLFHEADRMAVTERVAVIPLGYGRSTAFVKPRVQGWWEFGKSSSNFADLRVD